MAPVEAYIDNGFEGRTPREKGGIIIHSNPKYLLWWSGDESEKPTVSIHKIYKDEKTTYPIAKATLSRIGDSISVTINIFEEAPLFKKASIKKSVELKAIRVE